MRPDNWKSCDYVSLGQCIDLVHWAFDICDAESLKKKVSVSFNSRFTARAGDACFGMMRIRLSEPMWKIMDKQERYETVIHEACHLITAYFFPISTEGPHGPNWRHYMLRCGVKPEARHSIDRTEILRGSGYTEAYCGCPKPHLITWRKHASIKSQTKNYRCKSCKRRLELIK